MVINYSKASLTFFDSEHRFTCNSITIKAIAFIYNYAWIQHVVAHAPEARDSRYLRDIV